MYSCLQVTKEVNERALAIILGLEESLKYAEDRCRADQKQSKVFETLQRNGVMPQADLMQKYWDVQGKEGIQLLMFNVKNPTKRQFVDALLAEKKRCEEIAHSCNKVWHDLEQLCFAATHNTRPPETPSYAGQVKQVLSGRMPWRSIPKLGDAEYRLLLDQRDANLAAARKLFREEDFQACAAAAPLLEIEDRKEVS